MKKQGVALEELALLAKQGDEDAFDAIYHESLVFLKSMANLYFMLGADREDVIQEGMIGLFIAVRTYDPAAGASFRTFSELCVKRRIINAVKKAGRHKHDPLNASVSIEHSMNAVDKGADPEEIVLLADLFDYIEKNSESMFSKFEYKVWHAYISGMKTADIAAKLVKPVKSIDNALQRIHQKIRKLIALD